MARVRWAQSAGHPAHTAGLLRRHSSTSSSSSRGVSPNSTTQYNNNASIRLNAAVASHLPQLPEPGCIVTAGVCCPDPWPCLRAPGSPPCSTKAMKCRSTSCSGGGGAVSPCWPAACGTHQLQPHRQSTATQQRPSRGVLIGGSVDGTLLSVGKGALYKTCPQRRTTLREVRALDSF